jgi:hypothetical protein
MNLWNSDEDFRLGPSRVVHVMDKLDLLHQFLPPPIQAYGRIWW